MEKVFCYTKALREIGVSYLGNVKHSAKMKYSYNAGTMTFCLYLAPWNLSGYQTCPAGHHCHEHCLNGSGRNKVDILAHGEHGRINTARIRRTRAFYEKRELFMETLVHEIRKAKKKADELSMDFSVRLDGCSDLSPEVFKLGNKNILELFPSTQFYDYTKVQSRCKLPEKYENYDITYSFDGYNWDVCEEYLKKGGRVAVVFDGELPETFRGYKVIDANGYDMRYIDPPSVICGLEYHKTANDYKSGSYTRPDTAFVVRV